MNEFLLVFRANGELMTRMSQRTPEELKANAQAWMKWLEGISSQGKLVDKGNRLSPSGKVVTPGNVIADGPYTELKECVMGYTMVRALSLDDAVALAKGCPILEVGGAVEVRQINNQLPA